MAPPNDDNAEDGSPEMAGVFGFIMVAGAIGTSAYYWLTYGRYEDFVLGRAKTTIAFFVWWAFLGYLYLDRDRLARRRAEIEAAHQRRFG